MSESIQTKKVDYIIVGQGLAGSCLALQLLDRGKRILVIDQPDSNSATQVAAGLFNPVSGRKMVKTWMADQLFPYLDTFYRNAERTTGSNFFQPIPVYRPFVSIEEQNEWMGRSSDPACSEFVDNVYTHPLDEQLVKNPFGGIMLKQSGFVNTHHFTRAVSNYIEANALLLHEDFDEECMLTTNGIVRYKEWTATRIVYCTGEKIRRSKYFSWLPIRPLKGETLTIQTSAQVKMIYNRGVYVVPDLWKVGATYSVADQTPGITREGRLELMAKLGELIAFPHEITGQEWGFRPTTPDRRPLLGSHPEIEQLVVFNGLGTKGVSLAPYFSGILCDWMETGNPLHDSVSVTRYKALYSKSS